ncbi:MAG TPA: succinate dehydrogenase cytochrome b subunit [Gemmatimonadales bacterium]|nr:succinate dehydrogenase cytochrome b subunit [Gemmatimonadales bacterium]
MLGFYRSTIGKKIIMAVSGVIGVLFLILHMAGNLQAFVGADRINNYAAFLHGPLEEIVLLERVILLVALVLHVLMAWQLTRRNRAARPVGYAKRDAQVSTLAARTMQWGGVLLLLFIVFHILHFTTLDVDPTFVPLDVYGNVLKAFRHPWRVAVYVIAMILLGLHLYHGVWSAPRTLGAAPRSRWPLRRRLALVLAILLWAGFTSVPVAAFLGILR